MSRIAVVLFYDNQGIADNYFEYYIKELLKVTVRIVVVCNGLLTSESRDMLQNYTNDIYCRENIGFDAWGYRSALIEYLGWDNLYRFDELLLTNYTSYGPFFPLSIVFETMEERGMHIDCWSLFRNHKTTGFDRINEVPLKWGYIPESMTSNFWVVRRKLLHSAEFKEFYEKLPPINSYNESTVYYEFSFSMMVKESGFLFDTFEKPKGNGHMHNAFNHDSAYMLAKENAPILRRRNLFKNAGDSLLNMGYNDDSRKALEYIEKCTDYDANLIWDNLLRSTNQHDFFRTLQLNYVLPSLPVSVQTLNTTYAAVFYVGGPFEEMGWSWTEYINNLPEVVDVYIYTDGAASKEGFLPESEVIHRNYRLKDAPCGLDVGTLISFLKYNSHYKYVCFVNTYFTEKYFWKAVGYSRFKRSMDGVLESSGYVQNIINLFEENPRLGIVSAPLPYHAEFFRKHEYEWTRDFAKIKHYCDAMGLDVQIDEHKNPVRVDGRIMWFRSEAIKPLVQLETLLHMNKEMYDTVNLFDWLYPLIAQNSGFYPAYVASTEMARTDLSNLVYILEKNIQPFAAFFESLPAKFLMLKICKKFVPKKIWRILRKVYLAVKK